MIFRFLFFIICIAAVGAYVVAYGIPYLYKFMRKSKEKFEEIDNKVNPVEDKEVESPFMIHPQTIVKIEDIENEER